MSAHGIDPIIASAQERLRLAAGLIERGRAELRAVLAELEEHPDYVRARRSRDREAGGLVTLAWYLHNGTESTLRDVALDEAPELIRDDAEAATLAASMREFIETEAADVARRTSTRRSAATPSREAVAHG